jgi:hypothetical protein
MFSTAYMSHQGSRSDRWKGETDENSRLLEFGTSHFIFQLVHDVMLSPISRSTPFPWGLSTTRLRALVAYFGASV